MPCQEGLRDLHVQCSSHWALTLVPRPQSSGCTVNALEERQAVIRDMLFWNENSQPLHDIVESFGGQKKSRIVILV